MNEQKSNPYILLANGEWQTLLPNLEGLSAFEIVGYAQGCKGEGKYSVIHSIAINAHTGKRGRIQYCRDYYGWKWWRRVKLRWIGNTFDYQLQIKTCSDYGGDGRIIVYVKSLLKNGFEYVE